jgi:hypothetical protein
LGLLGKTMLFLATFDCIHKGDFNPWWDFTKKKPETALEGKYCLMLGLMEGRMDLRRGRRFSGWITRPSSWPGQARP